MTIAEAVAKVRSAVALCDAPRLACVRVQGEGAFAAVDRRSTARLRLQHAQAKQTLFLDEAGVPVADALVCRDEEDFLVLADGLPGPALASLLADGAPGPVRCLDLAATHQVISLTGPWAWELLGEVLGPDLLGMPYLSLYRSQLDGKGEVLTLRAGTTGEFGYELLAPREVAAALADRLLTRGARMGAVRVPPEALEVCALENGFFSIRREGAFGLTPLELQLQWRVALDRDFVGAAALKARRAQGPTHRTTHFTCAEQLAAGDPVELFGERVGRVLTCAKSPLRGDVVGIALLELAWAHAGIEAFTARRGERAVPLRTAAPPHLNNLSLYVSPLHHSFAGREAERFPQVVVQP